MIAVVTLRIGFDAGPDFAAVDAEPGVVVVHALDLSERRLVAGFAGFGDVLAGHSVSFGFV